MLTADLYVIGIGPGNLESMSRKAYKILKKVDTIVGYTTYIECIEEIITAKQQVYVSGMRKEKERVKKAIEFARKGKKVALISSGDPGVYGMAGLALEMVEVQNSNLKIEVVPGITAANAAAAVLGAPLMHDYAVISLSDILTPWDLIVKRLKAAAEADLITVLYNPRSSRRKKQLRIAREIYLANKDKQTPVGIVRNIGRDGEEKIITNLEEMPLKKVDMLTTVIIGNSQTYTANGKLITPRGYDL
ncbi:cobalt-precorrin 3 C17-methyltransferase [Halanaerobium saccharolyticum]|uniref:Cobalt-precorrin 3 C17-methyltransferase n=1 Tax=Halanaerobium saccharolyticum TaxID=43595 RepID=A0A4R7Z6X1_9FIRM|nr:precorrin-3B C(17)-methyltransferase [Halanaerobium saccharolyticum]RAK10580.1 cobalt-precorrin 3 C17-methyltransferase [Halanaerobium saccharolyticum]TDW06663.1 cobalt-precorrin 3 C17-methyltransferase [Halanaerobium saccharolyticum]TDX62298.1 cobalt-precorrin 3 C17-methyltransferase [Halanaerobium saccharolyticum]